MKRNCTVDIMKSMAIVMVIMCHVAQPIKGLPLFLKEMLKFGQLGVQIFFMMTAYLCCSTMEKTMPTKSYYLKKYFRLAPAYYFGIVFYTVLFLVVSNLGLPVRLDANTDVADILLNVLLVNNFSASACNTVVPGGWSISCIWIFFLLAPIMFSVMYDRKKLFFYVVFKVIGYIILGYITMNYMVIENNSFWYFSFINQSVSFEVGILLWHLEKKHTFSKWTTLLFSMITTAVTIYLFYYSKTSITWIVMPISASLMAVAWYLFAKNLQPRYIIGTIVNISNTTLSLFIIHPFFVYYGIGYSYKIFEKFEKDINSILALVIFSVLCWSASYFVGLQLEKIFNRPLIFYKKYYLSDGNLTG